MKYINVNIFLKHIMFCDNKVGKVSELISLAGVSPTSIRTIQISLNNQPL